MVRQLRHPNKAAVVRRLVVQSWHPVVALIWYDWDSAAIGGLGLSKVHRWSKAIATNDGVHMVGYFPSAQERIDTLKDYGHASSHSEIRVLLRRNWCSQGGRKAKGRFGEGEGMHVDKRVSTKSDAEKVGLTTRYRIQMM